MALRIAARYDPCRTVKADLQKIKADLALVKARLFNPCWGLREIKREIKRIECAIFNHTFGLSEIKTEISAIEAKLDNPSFGLSEIKAEISQIQACVCDHAEPAASNLTTGPIIKEGNEQALHLKAINYTSATQTVTFSVFNLANCLANPTLTPLEVTPCCAASTEINIGNKEANLEIRAELGDPSMLVSAATRTGNPGGGGNTLQRYPAALWLPLATFCTPTDID